MLAESMDAYPITLRERIVSAYDRGEGSIRELARIFDVSKTTTQNYLNRRSETGTLTRSPRRNGPPPLIDEAGLKLLRAMVEANPDRTAEEYVTLYAKETGVTVSCPVMYRALQRAEMYRKKSRSTPPSRSNRA